MSEETAEYRTNRTANREIHLTVSPQESAHLGMLCLKQAVLGILEQPEHIEKGLQPGAISEALGIEQRPGWGHDMVNAILWQLQKDERVRQEEWDRGPWRVV